MLLLTTFFIEKQFSNKTFLHIRITRVDKEDIEISKLYIYLHDIDIHKNTKTLPLKYKKKYLSALFSAESLRINFDIGLHY